MKKISYTIDVEKDLHSESHTGITSGLKRFEEICNKNKVKPILFVTGKIFEKNAAFFKQLHKKKWEISCHGYSHKRFDDMSFKEKEDELKKCVSIWKKHLGSAPKGFRAPQHSIDTETLDLLEKYHF
ncbi:MAG: polysaccharide deacetylase family protein, partial [Nanoarchaeota archaeon]|nr:polysaccharide deacetylase family protein [Nanoarchaeota archaeon]